MAKITLSPLIVDIRQSVADMTFSKWRGVNYVRSKVTPANPNTTAQQDVRNSMARCVDFWQALTAKWAGAWNYVATGRPYSGYNRFTSENRATEETLATLVTSPITDVTALTSFSAATGVATGEIDLTFTPSPVPTGDTLEVICRVDPVGSEKTVSLQTFSIAAGQASPQTVTVTNATTAYQVYGALADDTLGRTSSSSASSATSGT